MSISNYGDLKSTVASYLNRSDLASYIPDFITFACRRIHYGSDAPYPSVPVRIPAMQNRATGSISSSAIAFPTGFLEIIRLRGQSGTTYWTIDPADLNTFTDQENGSNVPSLYQLLNNEIEVAGSGLADYTLDYYKAFDAFSADADTNWLLTNSPDVYVFGALVESSPFLMDKDSQFMLSAWFGAYKSIVSALNRSTGRLGSGLRVRAQSVGQ